MGVTFSAAAIGGWASANAPGFYALLNKPAWAPPAAVFGPVWTVLYLLMAVAAWLVWQGRPGTGIRRALSFYLVQLALNALWTWVFFAWRQGGWALVEIVVLWIMITYHPGGLLPTPTLGRIAAGTLPGLGQLCRGAERGAVADESGAAIKN